MLTNQIRSWSILRISSLSLVFLVSFRLSTCYSPPPMVRIYDYSIPQDEVLSRCQNALMNLGYEIDTYSPLDYHFVTKEKIVKKLFRRAHYIIYVKAEDRITVYVYAEVRTFKRASEIGLMVGDLTELEASHNLSLSFQNKILDPITREFEKRGFTFWDSQQRNRADDIEIRAMENNRQKRRLILLSRKKKKERITRNKRIEQYVLERDLSRWEAVHEAEYYTNFLQDSTTSKGGSPLLNNWSLIRIGKTLVANDYHLEKVLREVLQEYRNYGGHGKIDWIIDPEGRVIYVDIQLDTTPYTPDDELKHYISSAVRRMIFPPTQQGSRYLGLSRTFDFSGNYHNLKYHFDRPRISALFENYPPIETETVTDTFFNTKVIPVR